MKKHLDLFIGSGLLIAFIVWTILVKTYDVLAIGPCATQVGFATLNNSFREMIGYDFTGYKVIFYNISEILLYSVILIAVAFSILGLIQWIRRRSFLKVDRQILVLGGAYLLIIILFILFEFFPINYRPILLDGETFPKASYPSTHTFTGSFILLSCVVMISYIIRNKTLKNILSIALILLFIINISLRLFSGVHWLSDIIGGLFITFGIFFLFKYFVKVFTEMVKY